jgi:cephalosporin hydroxylase
MFLKPATIGDRSQGKSLGPDRRTHGDAATIPRVSVSRDAPRIDIPDHLSREDVERISRAFIRVYHDLKEQTFATTTWLRVPLVKTVADIVALQEVVAETRPELIVETGVYVGGSALLFASVMEMLGIDGRVIAVDVDLAFVNDRVREHPRIELIEGSSTDPEIFERIRRETEGKRVMVDLDADHRAHHVLEELRLYSPLVSPGCYLVVEDGILGGRPVRPEAAPGPSDALDAWLAEDPPFEPDRWRERFLLTQNPRGYLRRIGEDGETPPRRERPENFLIGSLEESGDPDARAGVMPGEGLDEAAARMKETAGEPDREVEALRVMLKRLEDDVSEPAPRPGRPDRSQELTIENLLREVETQRQVLSERTRLLERERGRLRRITESRSYRLYKSLRGLPGVRQSAARRDRRRRAQAGARRAQRSKVRSERDERLEAYHRDE